MPGVVYLASWPRSGNTLLRAILWQCFGLESCSTNSEESMYKRNPDWHKLTGAVPFPRRMKEIQQIIDEQGVCFFKTHMVPDELAGTPEDRRIDDETRTIYLIRDGREACVSYWHYYRDILEDSTMTLERIIRGDCLFGSWSEHVRTWGPERRNSTLLFRYEDVVLQMETEKGWQAAPIALSPTEGVLVPNDMLSSSMTLVAPAIHPTVLLRKFLSIQTPESTMAAWGTFQQSDPLFFRSGTNDTWKTEMVGDDLALFDELHGDTMREYGYYPAKEPVYA